MEATGTAVARRGGPAERDALAGLRPTGFRQRAYWQGQPPPFDPEALVSTEANRWNVEGVPTVYLAGDVGLALVEGGRHLPAHPPGGSDRTIWSVLVQARGIVDLRPWLSDGLVAERAWVFDRSRCHALADRLRSMEGVSGMLVPSAGSLDDVSRWNLVLYVDRIDRPLEQLIGEPQPIGRIALDGEP